MSDANRANQTPEAAPTKAATTDLCLGWSLSLVLHIVTLLLFAGIKWTHSPQSAAGETETPVDIVVMDEAEPLASPETDIQLFQPSDSPVELAQVSPTMASTALPQLDIELPESTPDVDAAITLQAAAPQPESEPAADWQAMMSGSAAEGGSASFFGLRAQGSRFVFVVDRSGSMSGDKILAAKAELLRSVFALQDNMRFYVVFYSSRPLSMPADKMVLASEENKQQAAQWIETVDASGGTRPEPAMQAALALKPHAIWLLSDGMFSPDACEAIRQANASVRAQINTIAFYDNQGEALLQRIARENRGRYRFVGSGWGGHTHRSTRPQRKLAQR